MPLPFFSRRRASETAAAWSAAVPDGNRVYVIGDVHGRADLLHAMHEMILADAGQAPDLAHRVIHLGDYVDRGRQSAEVIDLLVQGAPRGLPSTCLLGNHEFAMLTFLDGGDGADWLEYGGIATVRSYGVELTRHPVTPDEFAQVRDDLRRAMPPDHRTFLDGLPLTADVGDYLCVHAGIRPGFPLDKQDPADLLMIRWMFLESDADHGKVVVHGHTISDQPVVRPNRIGIDTGAFATGRLTCLVLEGNRYRFLSTGHPDLGG